MKKKGGDWTIPDLNVWLTDPAAYVPGTKMGYPGEKDPKKRAQIIAFLRTLSDHPVALANEQDGAQKAEADHLGEAKTTPPGAKPGDQKPPAPPNPPGAAPPAPTAPEPTSAAGGPTKPEAQPVVPAPQPQSGSATPSAPAPPKANTGASASPPRSDKNSDPGGQPKP